MCAAQDIVDRLELKKTTQIMKNLEVSSRLVNDKAMAPQDMVALPLMDVNEDDIVSINLQPELHKRSRSPVADDKWESSEFVQILEAHHADKVTEKQKLDWADDVEGLDLFSDEEVVEAEPFPELPTFEQTLIPVPRVAFPHFDNQMQVREMCPQKEIIFVQPNLDKYAQEDGTGVLFKLCGHFDVIKSDQKWFLPIGYCLVDQGYRLEAHWVIAHMCNHHLNIDGCWIVTTCGNSCGGHGKGPCPIQMRHTGRSAMEHQSWEG
jgi:hypothetical protein